MNGLPYYPRYPRDFFDGTNGMAFELKGAYSMLLDLIYMSGGQLYDEPRFIAGHMNCSVRAWNGYRAALIGLGKISVQNGIISNFRADKELKTQRTFQDKQRKNGSEPKKNNNLGEAVAKPKASHTDTDTESKGGGGSARGDASQTFREQILTACRVDPISGLTGHGGRQLGTQGDMAEAARWLELPGITEAAALAEISRIIAAKRDGPPRSFGYFTEAMRRLSADLTAPSLQPAPQTTPAARGTRHDENRAFGAAIHQLASGLSAGTVHLETASRNPWAQ